MTNTDSIWDNDLGFFELDSKGDFTYIDDFSLKVFNKNGPLQNTTFKSIFCDNYLIKKWEEFDKDDSINKFSELVNFTHGDNTQKKYSLIINKITTDKKKRYLGYIKFHFCNISNHLLDDRSSAGMALHKIVLDKDLNPTDYIFVKINKAFEKLLGLNAKQVINKKVTQIFPNIKKDSFDWIRNYGKVALTGEPIAFEQFSAILDRWYYVTAYSPYPEYFLAIFHDITDKKNIENKLIKAQTLAQLAHFEWIPGVKIISAPKQLKKILGLGINENLTIKTLINVLPSKELKIVRRKIFHSSDRNFFRFTCSHSIQTIKHKYIKVYYEISRNKNNKISRIFCTIQNITHQKNSEILLKRLQEKAQESNLLKTRLLSTMGHEIRNQLNIIQGITEIKLLNHSSDENLKYLKEIWQSSTLIAKYVNDILDFSNFKRTKQKINYEHFDLYALVDSLKESFKYELQKNGISLIIKINKEVPDYIYSDQDKIKQILANLILNSLKFTSKGHISISVEQEISTARKQMLQFSVTDTGGGIDPSIKEHIFDEYVHTKRRHPYKSTGLGLFICKHLVNLLGGHIWVKESSKSGTTLSFNLKYQKGSQQHIKNSFTKMSLNINNSKKILIIENNELTKEILVFFIKKMNHQVDESSTYQESLSKLENKKYDFIVIDIELPDENGLHLAKKIKKGMLIKNLNKLTPITLISGHDIAKYQKECLTNKIEYCLQKPIKLADLKNIIDLQDNRDTSKKININDCKKNIMKIYMKNFPKRISTLKNHLKERNFEKMAYSIHELKNSTSILIPHTKNSYQMCKNIEHHLNKEKSYETIEKLFPKLIKELIKESHEINKLTHS